MADRGRLAAGIRLALTTLTVAPLRPGRVDRGTASVAMALAPAVGALLGLLTGAAGIGLLRLGAPAALGGVLVVAAGVGLTRGLHLDGLADTVDALGSYRGRAAALEIMRRPEVGPFGVIAIVLALVVQTVGASALLARPGPAARAGVVVATTTGRIGACAACRRGVPAARADGLGALVAGSVRWPILIAWTLAVAALALPAVPGRPWHGPLAVLLGLSAAALLVRHAVRRLGGITGDVLGAACEISVTLSYFTLSI
ncbi:MAG: adenosylcobinamide-GDP ribazoletransferase [Micromonosporaceae bacterium]